MGKLQFETRDKNQIWKVFNMFTLEHKTTIMDILGQIIFYWY